MRRSFPALIRDICFEGWKPLATPVENRRNEDFIARVEAAFADERQFGPGRRGP